MRPAFLALVVGWFSVIAPSSVAYAADDDDDGDLLEEDEEEKKKKDEKRLESDDEIELEDDEKELDGVKEDPKAKEDLLGGDETPIDSDDTASIYREYAKSVEGQEPDEELQAWEAYLAKYPKSAFRERIEKRIAELEDAMYAKKIEDPTDEPKIDADKREIRLSQPLLLDNINPRRKIQAGFEWGLPQYVNLFADYEHAFRRDLSVHAGIRRRYTGFRAEVGVKYAFIKSSRLNTVVSVLGDFHVNTVPAYPVFRPQLGVGKKFGKYVDVQAQGGVEIDTRKHAGVRGIGGINVAVRPTSVIAFFVESTLYMQQLKSDKGTIPYRYNAMAFGMKLFPKFKAVKPNSLELNIGATLPYTNSYWMYHYGSFTGQVNYYL